MCVHGSAVPEEEGVGSLWSQSCKWLDMDAGITSLCKNSTSSKPLSNVFSPQHCLRP